MALSDFTGTVAARIRLTATKAATISSTGDATYPLSLTQAIEFALGAGANQANDIYVAHRTLTASTSESLDFKGGPLLNPMGTAIDLSEVKGIFIFNSHATQNLTIGGANNLPGFTTARVIGPGGFEFKVEPGASGIVVTAGTGDLLTFANGAGTSLIYDIVVWGN